MPTAVRAATPTGVGPAVVNLDVTDLVEADVAARRARPQVRVRNEYDGPSGLGGTAYNAEVGDGRAPALVVVVSVPGTGRAAPAPDTGSLRGDLPGLLGRAVAFLGEPEDRAVARAALAAPAEAHVAALAARRLEAPATAAIEALVARARARGEWRADVAPELVLPTLIGALLHRTLLEHAVPDDVWLEGVVDLLVRGAAPRTGA
ncbi:MAG: TetR-like C-terminal domain-containing protein [Trueperaceae bacterium]|nr:TetR-like C-terminal domain-containing protein [Trueperaceae bacterium]